MLVKLDKGNIADYNVDIIVNAANTGLWMGGGVAGAIRAKGGIEIHQEALKYKPAKIGDIVITKAGKLNAKYVFHAVVIDELFRQGTSLEIVDATIKNIIDKMYEVKQEDSVIKSIAIPFLGAGVGGLKLEDVTYQILRSLEDKSKDIEDRIYVTLPILKDYEFEQAKKAFNEYKSINEERESVDMLANDLLKSLGSDQYAYSKNKTKRNR